ncbi:hypothetical protein J31TS4_26710 [Paenibacillus sp. J31TS4]|uniref:RNA polymerase sigma factor n=1 Tax=Paenibacillus sp. J31TS4 TaxID=2807195 RepID=UPI001B0DE4C9|nr:RNA polymerase sigma factor [Paenibacillus sp. J31TS4]GIP39391.1 hypothetical protein J31TS4_26710 [Paenibacillus sp. J31TS4]
MSVAVQQASGKTAQGDRFASLIEPYRPVLSAYCRSLTRSAWEGDDLAQDTWLKAYLMHLRQPGRQEMSRTYLFRIALRTWIDRCRREQAGRDRLEELAHRQPGTSSGLLEEYVAMESLVALLPPRQLVAYLLVELLRYSAGEAAVLTGSTEGAVKACLHRARRRLESLRQPAQAGESEGGQPPVDMGSHVDERLVYAYLRAFVDQDAEALVRLLNEGGPDDAPPAVLGRKAAGAKAASSITEEDGAVDRSGAGEEASVRSAGLANRVRSRTVCGPGARLSLPGGAPSCWAAAA